MNRINIVWLIVLAVCLITTLYYGIYTAQWGPAIGLAIAVCAGLLLSRKNGK